MQFVPYLVSRYLVRNICNLRNKSFTQFGIDRLQRNLVAIQQNLALLVANVEESDDCLLTVRRYYQYFEYFDADKDDVQEAIDELKGCGYSDAAIVAFKAVIDTRDSSRDREFAANLRSYRI